MSNGEPANAQPARQAGALAGLKFQISHFRLVILFALMANVAAAVWAQGNTAVVTGAEHVFIRRGPGTEFPPFATLMEGSTVEVQELHGEWARVLTASGQSGYVKSNFLGLPGERSAASTPPGPAPVATRAPAAPTAQSPAAVARALTEENQKLTAQIEDLQQQLAALKAQAEATPAVTPTPVAAADTDRLSAELARLNTTVQQLQQRLENEPPRVNVSPLPNLPTDAPAHVVTSTTILLTVVGLCLGWLIGNAYGRRQERGRRPRVRL